MGGRVGRREGVGGWVDDGCFGLEYGEEEEEEEVFTV